MRPPYRSLLALGALALLASPALAAQAWYEYYLQARDSDIPERRWSDCLQNLDAALKQRPGPANNVRTYGMIFIDYLPHYYRGVCLMGQEDYAHALEAFKREEESGAIRRTRYEADLVKRRLQAEDAEKARITREAVAEAQRLLREAQELGRRRSWDDALASLKKALVLAPVLDTQALDVLRKEQARIQAEQKAAAEAAARRQRLEQRIAEGQRLLQEGKPSDAKLAFDEAFEIDPHDVRAAQGRAAAQERILGTITREKLRQSGILGKQLFDAGQYEQALGPLTDAAADPENFEARTLLARDREIVERIRKEKEKQAEIDRLMARGEEMMKAGRFAEAQVAFEAVLRLDPGHARARERKEEAERRTGEAVLARFLPNQEPTLALFPEPEDPVIEGPSLSLRGVATDDRGVERVEFRKGDQLIAETAGPKREIPFAHVLPLDPGPNTFTVTARDTGGLAKSITITVERRLRFYESPYFRPLALAGAVSLLGLGWAAQLLRRRRARRLRFNPYIAGAPVLDGEMFYGREKLTARMLSTLHRNSLMITGERRIGKTTFLHHLKRVLEQDETGDWRFFPVFVDLQGVPEQVFFHALMAEVIEALDLSPETRQALRFRPEPGGYDAREFSHDLQLVIGELKTRTERKVKLALLIDEVDVLNSYSEGVNQRLRGIFMKSFSENLVAVMSGVAIRRRWNSEVSPWYNFFDEIELAPFTREEAEALICEPVAGVFRFRADAVERILELSRLRPYLIQKYCVHAVGHMLEEGRGTIRRQDVEAARATVESEGRLERQAAGTIPPQLGPVAD